MLADGSFYLVFGLGTQTFVTHRFANGALDVRYGDMGYSTPVSISNAKAALQADGKVVIGGDMSEFNLSDFAFARINVNGKLDKSFAGDGTQNIDFSASDDHMNAIAIQSDGKIVTAGFTYKYGQSDFAMVRLNTDGTTDNSFSGDGKQTTDFGRPYEIANAIALNGSSIFVAGYSAGGSNATDAAIACYRPEGYLDTWFSGNGKMLIAPGAANVITSIAISGNRIFFGGNTRTNIGDYDFMIISMFSDGYMNSSWGVGGIVKTDIGTHTGDGIEALITQPDGKVIAGGRSGLSNTSFSLVRYTVSGAIDNSFSGGKVITPIGPANDYLMSLALRSNGQILAAGYVSAIGSPSIYAAVLYNPNGTLNSSLDADGILTDCKPTNTTRFQASVVQPDGKLIVVGYTAFTLNSMSNSDIAVARYDPDGSLDRTFSNDGLLTIDIGRIDGANCVALQPDGKILVGGQALNTGSPQYMENMDFALVRINSDGTLDDSFSGDGKVMTDFRGYGDGAYDMALLPDGKIVLTGTSIYGLYNSPYVYTVALARYNSDGTIDNTFGEQGKTLAMFSTNDFGNSLMVQPDGKLLVAGTYNYAGLGSSSFLLARFNSNGTLDNSFDGDGWANTRITGFDEVRAAALQPDGKIVLAGQAGINPGGYLDFIRYYDLALVRYNKDGSLDNSFSGDGKLTLDLGSTNESFNSIKLQPNGKLIAGGHTILNNYSSLVLTRFNTDGTLDNSFSGDGIVTMNLGGDEGINTLSISGKRVYGAGITTYGGILGLVSAFQLGCTESMNVTIPDAMALSSGVAPNTVYIGYEPASRITLTAEVAPGNGPYSYLWSNGATTRSITVSPAVQTSYNVAVSNLSGCSGVASIVVNVKDVRCGNKLDKVEVCQVPQGNSSNDHSICISANAVAAHLRNGGYLGSCGGTLTSRISANEKISEGNAEWGLSAFPNPSSTGFNVVFKSQDASQAELIVRDNMGRLVERKLINPNTTIKIGMQYRPGVYILELVQGKTTSVKKLIKISN